ncbi:MAG: site-specific integrase, partial [Flavobacteriales bacterium]
MDWDKALRGFRLHLKLERSLSDRTIAAYMGDLTKLRGYAEERSLPPAGLSLEALQQFAAGLSRAGDSSASQARRLSAVRMFHRYLRLEKAIADDPSALLESPRLGRRLPVFLTVEEVNAISDAVDLSRPLAHRDKAIVETLYGCGLRVSELCGLRL